MKFFNFILALFIILITSCTKDNDCIDESKIHNNPCAGNIFPVCGCDGKTYNNPCEAEREGVISFTDGACK